MAQKKYDVAIIGSGSGEYRSHFFGDTSMLELLKKGVEDQSRYSVPALNRRRKTRARLAWQKHV